MNTTETEREAKPAAGFPANVFSALASVLPGASKKMGGLVKDLASIQGGWDVIIVGGGTTGCTLAARLTEDPELRVLMLEAGGTGMDEMLSRTPSGFGKLFHGPKVYEVVMEPQVHAAGQKRYMPQGKLLGGSSSINAQMAQFGSPSDYDQWARVTGDDSWTWKNLAPYFKKFETCKPDPKYPKVDHSLRGQDGPVQVGYFNYVSEASKAFIEACGAIGIPFVADFNTDKGPIGASRIMTYVDSKGARSSAESAYLTKEVLARPNLKVTVFAQVTRLLFDDKDGEKVAVGVEFANSENGPRFTRAKKEIVLSAGAVHSPHVLMLSGVGPAEQLKEHKIPVVLDFPGVGSNLIDHPVVDIFFADKHGVSLKYLAGATLSDKLSKARAIVQYLRSGSGSIACNFGESAAFLRTDDPKLFPPAEFPALEDTTSGSDAPDLEMFTTPMGYRDHGGYTFTVHSIGLHIYLVRPKSRGEVKLRSASPFQIPSVNPNYLQHDVDLQKLVRGVRVALKIAQAQPLASHLDETSEHVDLDHKYVNASQEELEKLVKDRVETVYHPASTCRMGPRETGAVVDSQLRVYGIKNLRICDASVFPDHISGHTAAACFVIGEKMADIIKVEFAAGKR